MDALLNQWLLTLNSGAMKKLLFVTFILIFCCVWLSAQPCLPNGIEFNTQAQIDSFQINHPNCTEIEGGVSISGNDIVDGKCPSCGHTIYGEF